MSLTRSLLTTSSRLLRSPITIPALRQSGFRSLHVSSPRLAYHPNVDANGFEELVVKKKDGIVLVDFFAEWCGPCHALAPILKKASEAANVDLVTIDIDNNAEIASKYSIRALPTVVAFSNGQEVSQFVGALPPGKVKEFVEAAKGKA